MDIIGDIIRREGPFIDHPADRGGPTKYGITLATLASWRQGMTTTAADVQAMSEATARDIYQARYIIAPGFDKIAPEQLRNLVVDIGVMSGPARATRLLQQALGVTVDGMLGPVTLGKLPRMLPETDMLYRRLIAVRMQDLGRIITGDPSQAVFAAGWFNRLAGFLA